MAMPISMSPSVEYTLKRQLKTSMAGAEGMKERRILWRERKDGNEVNQFTHLNLN